ncbi:diguanylate cyclase [Anderseniella sp. Alg231-50]|uniref:diguanylate cyclase n=1 Tax=Anderseniella sp. Alg231-50 TaxID=1922226 RepID=UPI000D560163
MTDTNHLRAMVDDLRSSIDLKPSDQDRDDTQIQSLLSDRSALKRLVSEYRILREALDKSPMAYCVYDERDRLIAANPAYERLHPGLAELRLQASDKGIDLFYADLVRRELAGKVSSDELEAAVSERVEAQKYADGAPVERSYHGSGDFRIMKYRLSSGGSAGIALDITELKQREAELDRARNVAEEATERAETSLKSERSRKLQARQLSELGEWLQSCKTVQELFVVVERLMPQMFPSSEGELYIYSNSRDVLDGACQWNRDGRLNKHIQPDDCWALRRGRMMRYGEGLSNIPCAHAAKSEADGEQIPPYVCIPILAHGETVGLLHIRFPKLGCSEQQCLDDRVLSFALQCAEHISLAVANAKLRDELEQQSIRDPLTGLYNRRHFMNQMHHAMKKSGSAQKSVGLIALDADNFKTFNDVHGHNAGDVVLCAISEALLEAVRPTDTVARFGGEEFAVLLADTNTQAAEDRAEAIRAAISGLSIRYGEGVLPQVTVSCGVAGTSEFGYVPQELLRAADMALYRAKDTGRNRVCRADPADAAGRSS